jgi:hypothetical protein
MRPSVAQPSRPARFLAGNRPILAPSRKFSVPQSSDVKIPRKNHPSEGPPMRFSIPTAHTPCFLNQRKYIHLPLQLSTRNLRLSASSPTNKGHIILEIAQSTLQLTKKTSRALRAAGSASVVLPICNNSIFPHLPTHKNSPPKNPFFPRKNTMSLFIWYLKTWKTPSGEIGQKIAKYRKTPHQTPFMPQKCSKINPQQFALRPELSATSRPLLVQILFPEKRNNSCKKIPPSYAPAWEPKCLPNVRMRHYVQNSLATDIQP